MPKKYDITSTIETMHKLLAEQAKLNEQLIANEKKITKYQILSNIANPQTKKVSKQTVKAVNVVADEELASYDLLLDLNDSKAINQCPIANNDQPAAIVDDIATTIETMHKLLAARENWYEQLIANEKKITKYQILSNIANHQTKKVSKQTVNAVNVVADEELASYDLLLDLNDRKAINQCPIANNDQPAAIVDEIEAWEKINKMDLPEEQSAISNNKLNLVKI